MDRVVKTTYTIESGKEILEQGHYLAWEIWNILCFTFTGNGRKDYKGKYEVSKTLRLLPQAKNLSDRCYSTTLEKFDIAMKSWWSNLKRFKKGNKFTSSENTPKPPRPSKQPRNLKFQVGRNAKPIGNFKYKLTVLGGNIKDRHAIIQIHTKPGVKMSQVKWIELSPNRDSYLNIEVEENKIEGEGILAIDLGIVNIATLAFDTGESILVSGKGLLSAKQWGNKQVSHCKPSNWKRGKKLSYPSEKSKRYSKKIGNIQNLAIHNLTRFIINECVKRQVTTIIVGDLKGIRDKSNHGKAGNQKLHSWPFGMITEQLTYKGEEFGIKVLKRSEKNTSKCCHICGNVGVRNPRGLLKCKNCNITINSDVNGGFGILNNYLEEIGKEKVSPAKVGVEATFPGLPSPENESRESGQRIGKASQIDPTFITKFDLRNWSMKQIVATSQDAL